MRGAILLLLCMLAVAAWACVGAAAGHMLDMIADTSSVFAGIGGGIGAGVGAWRLDRVLDE